MLNYNEQFRNTSFPL